MTTTDPAYGSAAHARLITYGRSSGVQTAMAWLAFSHLPENLQSLSRIIYDAAVALVQRIPNDSAELKTALNTLVGAKDWFMRAGIRSDQGQPGPVPRPATVVDPPSRFETARDIEDTTRLTADDLIAADLIRTRGTMANLEGLRKAAALADDALIAEHLPSFGRPIQDRPQA